MSLSMLTAALVLLLSPPSFQDVSPNGRWSGNLEVMGQSVPLTVELRLRGSRLTGTVDIQGQTGMQLQNMTWEAPNKVHFELPTGGADVVAFDGTVAEEEITGTFTQGPAEGEFKLVRAGAKVPYKVEELAFQNGDVQISGTLTVPEGTGPYPAVVLISGAGAQNRDSELYGFPLFELLADEMTRQGYAVLRTDDRGVGKSTGSLEGLTLDDAAGDVTTAVQALRALEQVDAKRVGLLGHGGGSVVAAKVAADDEKISFLLLLAGLALPADEQAKALKGIWKEYEPPEYSLACFADDPAPILAKVKCPTLAMYGGRDYFVWPGSHEKVMREAFKQGANRDAVCLTFPDANYLFQLAQTGYLVEYGTLEQDFFPGFFRVVTEWLGARVGARP